MSSRNCSQVKDFPADRRVYTIGVVLERMGCKLGCTEDMLRGANDETKNCNNEDSASADDPDYDVESEFFSPSLTNILALHATEPLQEDRWNPPGKYPAKQHPASTRRGLLHNLGSLTLQNLTRERLFCYDPCLVRVLEHVA